MVTLERKVAPIQEDKKVVLKELFSSQRNSINYFFDNVDFDKLDVLLNKMSKCRGKIIFSGIGKSGIIAQKLAVMMISTGNQSSFLNPSDALHGDLGQVNEGDIVVFLSKSGESDELLNLIPYIKNKKAWMMAWVSNPTSRLAKQCNDFFNLPLDKELCPFNLAPATSSALQLILGDILVVALMHLQGFKLESYAKNHPSGRIGKRITYLVDDLMLKGEELPFCRPDDSITDVLLELSNKRCGCVLVVNQNLELQGIFTDGDLRRTLQNKANNALLEKIIHVMTKNPRVISKDILAYESMLIMEEDKDRPVTVLPVTEKGRVVGLIKMHDILQAGI
jgi:arabinose-5-phosphate isomerase